MALVKLSEASNMTGKSDKTLYRHAKTGKLSLISQDNGQKMVETSELIRVYGALRTLNESNKEVSMSPSEGALIKVLKDNIRDLKERLSEKDENLNDLRQQVKLITFVNEKNQEKKPLTWVWVLLAIIISVLATNLAYRILNPF